MNSKKNYHSPQVYEYQATPHCNMLAGSGNGVKGTLEQFSVEKDWSGNITTGVI